MVLRKERLPKVGNSKLTTTTTTTTTTISTSATAANSSAIMANEQPMTKRQRIDNRNGGGISNSSDDELLNEQITENDGNSVVTKDITADSVGPSTSTLNKPNQLVNTNSNNIPNSITSSPASSHNSSTDEVDKCTLHHSLTGGGHMSNNEIPRKSSISTGLIAGASSNSGGPGTNICTNSSSSGSGNGSTSTSSCSGIGGGSEMAEFEEYLIKQCLCGVSEHTLRKPFESHYSHDINGTKRIANLSEWPTNKLLQFLSNLQLLFDIYLKQNSKGFICSRIMDICDALIRNDHKLIDEIIELANFNNKYVQFLSGRVLASFLVIAKQNMDDNWLKKLVDNLFVFERMDFVAIRKIHFSLEIIKRIVEWKDIDTHPLEDEIDNHRNAGVSVTNQRQSLENNYFAVQFNSEMVGEGSSSGSGSGSINNNSGASTSTNRNNLGNENIGCHLITLTDSESFDTTHLKCITIKILENKWPALVKNMSNLISIHRDVVNAENCILTFLCLWENIISVKANLSIVETLPFYAQLDKFELLLNHDLSCTIYKQMLSLFNESLCYGSTLALQDLLPEETCLLAHQIVRHIKDFRILDSLPRRQPENIVSLIGYKGKTITYENDSIYRHLSINHHQQLLNSNQQQQQQQMIELNDIPDMDKIILQKMVLLVLKSVAVTVKEIRSDSSDSSIDSTDYDAFQDMVLIERSIRDVLKKLESFIKNTLEFHPECHFSKILIYLFDDQDDYLIEAMVCTLDVTSGISFRNNAFPELVAMLNPVLTFLEFLKMISNSSELLLDLLVSNETCFLLYLLRFLKYIRINWSMFVSSCHDFGMGSTNILDDAMTVLIRLRLQISRLVSKQLYPYDISPVLRLLESCESLYEGNELS